MYVPVKPDAKIRDTFSKKFGGFAGMSVKIRALKSFVNSVRRRKSQIQERARRVSQIERGILREQNGLVTI